MLRDLDEEDKHRTWYFEQLENIRRKVDVLPADVVIFIDIFLLNFNDDMMILSFKSSDLNFFFYLNILWSCNILRDWLLWL